MTSSNTVGSEASTGTWLSKKRFNRHGCQSSLTISTSPTLMNTLTQEMLFKHPVPTNKNCSKTFDVI